MGFYSYKDGDAERFSHHVNIQARKKGDELEFMWCPYCKGNGKDKNTFSINTYNGMFECKRSSCGRKGNMIVLSRDFGFSLGKDVDAYYRTTDYSKKQFKDFKDKHKEIEIRPAAVEYMASRCIPQDITEKYKVTTAENDSNILVFPFYDENGNMPFIKYRIAKFNKAKHKNKEWCATGGKPILFGMNHCDPEADNGRIIITEGQIDSLSVATAGYQNVVSVPTGCNGFTWVPYCWDFMNKFKQIIVFGDCENGKITLSEELAKRWTKTVKVCKPEDYMFCKDANELLQKHGITAVRNVIENATAADNKFIKPLAKVERVDILKMEWVSTGINSLDKILNGGFRFGQIAIMTGKRGDGKSTVASMFGVRALDNGHNCFFYSGELMDFYFRNWMDNQITGKKHINQSDYDQLNKWYGDKAYIYDDSIIDTDDEFMTLTEAVEIAILQKNCRFIVIDNLMTAMTDDLRSDLYRQQSRFVGNLAKIAKKYNVFILLIAHPRKTNGQAIDNDSVSGSSNITDKADLVLSYKKEKDGCGMITVLKNRLTGKTGDVSVVFDTTGSRRIAECSKDLFDIRFNWTSDVYQEEFEDTEFEDIPF